MHYNLRIFKFVAMLVIVVAAMSGGTASAQVPNDIPIPGLFVGIDTNNTVAQDGGGAFSSEFGFSNTWRDSSGTFTGNTGDSFVFDGNGNSSSPSGTGGFLGATDAALGPDVPIVTTVSGLEAGTYEVRFIFTGVFGNTDFQYATGFAADSTAQIANTADAEFYGAVGTNLGFTGAYGSLIGSTTVGADGELEVFTNILPDAFQNQNIGYNGLSLVQTSAVPEPGSLTLLLSLGSVALLRRRR